MTLVDGGGVSGGDAIRRSTGMSSKKADDGDMQRRYDIVVSKDEYETYRETGFSVSFDTSVIEKHIVMNRPGRTLPIAQAGEDCTVHAGNYVLFDASASHTANPPLKYTWYQCDSNPFKTIIITEDYFRTGELASVGFLREGVYSYYLTVTDSEGISRPDTVTVTVLPREDDCIFRDPGLEVAVRTALKNPSDPLTDDQLLTLKYLIYRVNAEKITHLDGIERCANLDTLRLGLQAIDNISPLASLAGLKNLSLSQNRILMDISPLQNLVELEYLDLSVNKICDITPLSKLVKITHLDLQLNPITDITALKNLTSMKTLKMSFSPFKSVNALENMIDIEELRLTSCGIEDISPLGNMTRMQSLRLYNNKYITDISPLGGMTDMYECHLFGNNISDLSPLTSLHSIALLKLSINNISDLSPIAADGAMKSLSLLFINSNPLSDISINEHIPRLKERGVTVDWSVR
jgi:Leucine-rich repeat (LRR) protein